MRQGHRTREPQRFPGRGGEEPQRLVRNLHFEHRKHKTKKKKNQHSALNASISTRRPTASARKQHNQRKFSCHSLRSYHQTPTLDSKTIPASPSLIIHFDHQVSLSSPSSFPSAKTPLVYSVPNTCIMDRKQLRNAQGQQTIASNCKSGMPRRDATSSTAASGTARTEFAQSVQPITNKPAPIEVEDWAAWRVVT